jgi:hypothetical protein
MKRIILSGLLLLGGLSTLAQTYDYSTNAGWSPNIRTLFTAPPGCALLPQASLVTAGTITIGAGTVNYAAVRGAHENRISTNTANLYDIEFNMDFDFNVTNTTSGKGIFAAVLTSQDVNPVYVIPMTVCGAAPIMDVLGVILTTPSPTSNADLMAQVSIYDDGVQISPTGSIPIAYGTTYYARLQVYGNERGELQLFSDPTRTTLVGSFCFDIPRTVNGLGILQHATVSSGGRSRTTTAWVDNTSIYRTDNVCCDIDIKGPNIVVGSGTDIFYDITTTGTGQTVSILPADVTFTSGPGTGITVTDWGAIATDPKLVTIVVKAQCLCEEIIARKFVYVYSVAPSPLAPVSETKAQPISEEENRLVNLYPNPTTGIVTIESALVLKEVFLLDSNGKILESQSRNSDNATIDLSAYPSGLYFVRLITEAGEQLEQVVKK